MQIKKPLTAKQLERAIAETSVEIRSGKDPERAWQDWLDKYGNDNPKTSSMTEYDITVILGKLIREPGKPATMKKCSDSTAIRRIKRINDYFKDHNDTLHRVSACKNYNGTLLRDKKGNIFIEMIDSSFVNVKKDKMEPYAIHKTGCFEYSKLQLAAGLIMSECGLNVRIDDTWFDYGQGWRWTTLLATEDGSKLEFQLLSPRDQKAILYGTRKEFYDAIGKITSKYS